MKRVDSSPPCLPPSLSNGYQSSEEDDDSFCFMRRGTITRSEVPPFPISDTSEDFSNFEDDSDLFTCSEWDDEESPKGSFNYKSKKPMYFSSLTFSIVFLVILIFTDRLLTDMQLPKKRLELGMWNEDCKFEEISIQQTKLSSGLRPLQPLLDDNRQCPKEEIDTHYSDQFQSWIMTLFSNQAIDDSEKAKISTELAISQKKTFGNELGHTKPQKTWDYISNGIDTCFGWISYLWNSLSDFIYGSS